jgi:hypothetical protein
MHTTAIGRQMGYHYTVVSRLVSKHTNQQCERLTMHLISNVPKHVCRSLFVFIAGEVAVNFVDIVDICSPSMFKLIFPRIDTFQL